MPSYWLTRERRWTRSPCADALPAAARTTRTEADQVHTRRMRGLRWRFGRGAFYLAEFSPHSGISRGEIPSERNRPGERRHMPSGSTAVAAVESAPRASRALVTTLATMAVLAVALGLRWWPGCWADDRTSWRRDETNYFVLACRFLNGRFDVREFIN